ncbi:MAG: DUF106 domain-containing protein [Thermoplasmata archaeon]
MAPDDAPLRSSADDPRVPAAAPDDETDETEDDEEEETPSPAANARPPPPQIKFSTMIFTFLFLLGILMIFDTSTRNQVAVTLGLALAPLIGFSGHYILLTMFLAAVIEMLLTAVAYNWTTDWVKAARVQNWAAAFRKVQMAAMRSGKKDRIAALQPHQQEITRLQSEVSMAQLKGMAVTWFLVIAIYTWVGLYIAQLAAQSPSLVTISLGGSLQRLTEQVWIMPLWFLLFSLYTVPLSLVFRRVLKHFSLQRHAATLPPAPATASGDAGGPA